MKNKKLRKILELEKEIESLKNSEDCECSYIDSLERRINEYKGIKEEYNEDVYNFDGINQLEQIGTREVTYCGVDGFYRTQIFPTYKCHCCGKPEILLVAS